jgi:hypothetical protein
MILSSLGNDLAAWPNASRPTGFADVAKQVARQADHHGSFATSTPLGRSEHYRQRKLASRFIGRRQRVFQFLPANSNVFSHSVRYRSNRGQVWPCPPVKDMPFLGHNGMTLLRKQIPIKRCKIITIVGLRCAKEWWCGKNGSRAVCSPRLQGRLRGWGLAPLNANFD